MKEKLNVGVLFGGRSVEHEISLKSATNVLKNIDQSQFNIFPIGIDKVGAWHLGLTPDQQFPKENNVQINMNPADPFLLNKDTGEEIRLDVVFPVLHGTDGEDGSVQGLLKILRIPVVGVDVLPAAITMSKVATKHLLEANGVPVAKYVVSRIEERDQLSLDILEKKLGLPCIAKPANLGSSVGVNKISDQASFEKAIEEGFKYDNLLLIEEFVVGKEFECGIIGNEIPKATVAGEVKVNSKHEFYTFEAKYVDPEGAIIQVPAEIPEEVHHRIMKYCEDSYKALHCNGFARADVFYTEDDRILLNEINAIPGFTDISMFPSLWAHAGLAYTDLITKLIDLAMERASKMAEQETHFESAFTK
ncbi:MULTISPECIES: D-alanine--D-alanine ligase family protein [Persicobacter]|uniref:D-alanine--D-alanine ligase n=1 Tax=Persicobacter diffluens TaxID=981 RepID=A0AAN4VXN7_9BACT|nr:D-alanine--D-alanine ligase family protein [Persicobacter sp. CCB-QB2]GJM61144.1 D-alanine--D-alanine ligase [Persicobacter diffluens]